MNPVILEVREEQQQSRLLFCPEGLIGICYLNRLILVEQDRILEGGGSSIVKIRSRDPNSPQWRSLVVANASGSAQIGGTSKIIRIDVVQK
jgi:hypothetical protein